jgi:hypothetical protein
LCFDREYAITLVRFMPPQIQPDETIKRLAEVVGKQFGIPKKYRQRQAVYTFTFFLTTLRNIQEQMTTNHDESWLTTEELFCDHRSWRERLERLWRRGIYYTVLPIHRRFAIPTPTLAQRYHDVEQLLRCCIAILEQGLHGEEISREYLRGKLNGALELYGLTVEYKKEA